MVGRPPHAKSHTPLAKHVGILKANHLQGTTVMGKVQQPNAECCGVLLQVNAEYLAQFDLREGGYNRTLVEWDHVVTLESSPKEEEATIPAALTTTV